MLGLCLLYKTSIFARMYGNATCHTHKLKLVYTVQSYLQPAAPTRKNNV